MNLFYKLVLFFFIVISPSFSKDKSDFKLYRGAWFEILYPENFTVKPSKVSNIPDKYDSVFFISPDETVRFYIYSPQWSGDSSEIKIKSDEKEIDTKTKKENGFINKWFTYKNKSGYSRSYLEVTGVDQATVHIFGFEYDSPANLKKYRKEYETFKKSLKQFAD
jgi:hypothetical protein